MDSRVQTAAHSNARGSENVKLLVVLGEGGHTRQMLNLVDLLGDDLNYYYIVSREDNLSTGHIKHAGPIYKLTRPRGKQTGIINSVTRTILTGVESLRVLLQVRPSAIVSAGPAIAVPVSILGKLLGVQIIFIESASRVTTLSLSGRIMYRWADLFSFSGHS